LEEDLVENLTFFSGASYTDKNEPDQEINRGKTEKFNKTFGMFPQTSLKLID
jgi:hypothetical protein